MSDTVRIIKLGIENFKRIEVAYLEFPDAPGLHVFTGKNRQGKSSILDAIWSVIGGAKAAPKPAIRDGFKQGRVVVELSNGLIAERTWKITDGNEETTSLVVRAKNGSSVKSPDAVLKAMFEPIACDPLAFLSMKEDEQYRELRALVSGIDWDMEERFLQADFDTRRDKNRELDRLIKVARSIVVPEGAPDRRRNPDTVAKRIEKAGEANIERERIIARRTALNSQITNDKAAIADLEKRIKALRDRLTIAEGEFTDIVVPDEVDTTEIRKELAEVARHNAAYDAAKERRDADAEVAAQQSICDDLTKKIEERRKRLVDAIASAKLPVPGLTITDKQVFFQGQPLRNCSGREQLIVSTAIAISKPAELKICLIKQGSNLDSDGLSIVATMLNDAGYEGFMEKVDESGQVGIVMVDGRVASTPESRQSASPKKRK